MTDTPIKSMDEVRAETLQRIQLLSHAREEVRAAISALGLASSDIAQAWEGWPLTYTDKQGACDAISVLANMVGANLENDLMAAAEQAGKLMARDVIAPIARSIDTDKGPVVWLTGNSYMPPLRSLSDAEIVYQADTDGDVWARFIEAMDAQLDTEQVLMECPEYDNALYVVDLARWEHVDGDCDNLNDEWQVRNG